MESADEAATGPEPSAVEQDATVQDAEVARSVAMETPNGDDDDVSLYQLKWIEWKGNFVPIVTQNDNGPCPLLALCNVLLLSGRMKLPVGETVVSSTHLTDLLGTYLIELRPKVPKYMLLGLCIAATSLKQPQFQVLKDLPDSESANYEQNITDAMAIFPKLQTGLDVNVKFNSVSGFEFTCESGLFDLLGVPLYHGWLVDPQDSASYDVITPLSFNQLVEMVINDTTSSDTDTLARALTAQQFLESTASQLTYHGLCELGAAVRTGELAVFFRNNHFSTLYRRKDQLLLLVTDHGFVNEAGHIWETLGDIDGSGDFLDAHFRPSGHSQTQQQRVGVARSKVSPNKDSSPVSDVVESEEKPLEDQKGAEPRAEDTPVITQTVGDVDYETALTMQRDEYLQAPNTALDEELAMQLQQVEQPHQPHARPHPPDERPHPPPNSQEAYEREAELARQHHRRDCIVL